MPNYIAPGPTQGPQNGLSIQHATRCASRFPNWKMGSTLQGLLLLALQRPGSLPPRLLNHPRAIMAANDLPMASRLGTRYIVTAGRFQARACNTLAFRAVARWTTH